MPPGSANTTEEGGKDTSIYFKISSPARFYNICSNYYLKHCTNLHILYCYPERVFFPPESSSFSEGNRLAKLTQQPIFPGAKHVLAKTSLSDFFVCTLGKSLFTILAIHVFEPPGRLHRPDHQSGRGPTCATCEPGPIGVQLAHVPRHIFFKDCTTSSLH